MVRRQAWPAFVSHSPHPTKVGNSIIAT